MSRLADRAAASVGAAVLPPEHGGPPSAELVEQLDRFLGRMPAQTRFGDTRRYTVSGGRQLPDHWPVAVAA